MQTIAQELAHACVNRSGDLGAVGAVMARSALHRLGEVENLPALTMEPDAYRARQSVGPIGMHPA
jgi:hypothetical protein